MESVGRKSRPRRSFTPEFKAEIVELCQRGVRSVGQVARDFDLTETAVREWVKQAERDAGTRDDGGLTSDERKQLAQLRKENRRGAEPQSGGRRPPFPSGAAARADRIGRDFTADASKLNTRWCADITYSAQLAVMCSPAGGPRRRGDWRSCAAHNQRPSRNARSRSPGWNRAGAGLGSVSRRSTASLAARSASRY